MESTRAGHILDLPKDVVNLGKKVVDLGVKLERYRHYPAWDASRS